MKKVQNTVNFAMVARLIGWLLIIEGVFMLFPLATCLVYGETDWRAFCWGAGTAIVCGLALTNLIRPSHHDMGKREGFLLTALVWVVFSAFGMLPFMLGPHPLSLSDAYFEAMSGFTTTGVSVMTSIEHLSHGILLWRAEMNWLGGMGIILFTLAVTPMLNHSGGMQMFNAEVTGITHEKLRPRVSSTAKGMWGVYGSLTLLLAILLWLGPMDFFDSVCHAMSTISTGGFSTRDGSIGAFGSTYVDCIVTIFMFLGGVNFALLYRGSRGNVKALFQNDVFRTFCALIAAIYMAFVVAIIFNNRFEGLPSVTIEPLFMVVSTLTSTGLTVAHFENWGPFCLALLFFMMFFGACAGSTSGGAKIDRLICLFKRLRNEIYRTLHPNSILSVRINGKAIPEITTVKVMAFLCLYVLVICVGATLLTMMNVPVVDAFFTTFSCIGNTGLSASITGYGAGFEMLPDAAKWVLAMVMLTGRLEVFTILILFTQGFWRK